MPRILRTRPVAMALVALAVLAAACAGPMPAVDPPEPCNQTTEFTFRGRASPQSLGVSGPMDPTAAQVGMAWVTAGPVDWGGGGAMGMQSRALCIQFDDGSGMGQSIEDDWVLPAGVIGGNPTETSSDSAPIGLLAGLAMAVLLVVVSVVAFARDGGRRTPR
ncbi:MAG TPA: hypothetical protein VLA76_07215 [Candidatus Angelobacter sp.]|nr:hypothetical protein [Candidatus Angelobacter sp.]